MIDPDSFPFLNISPFRTYFLFSLWSGGRGDFDKNETGEIFEVYGEKFDKNKILFFGNARKSRSVLHFSFFTFSHYGDVVAITFSHYGDVVARGSIVFTKKIGLLILLDLHVSKVRIQKK